MCLTGTVAAAELTSSPFQTVIAQKTIPAGYASWLEAKNLRVDIPQNAFHTTVSFEILQGNSYNFEFFNSKNEKVLANYAFRVRQLSNGQLLKRPEKAIEVGFALPKVENLQFWEIELANPENPIKDIDFQVINQTLVHQVNDFSLAWFISGQLEAEAVSLNSPTVIDRFLLQEPFPAHQSIWPLIGILSLILGLLWLINHVHVE